MIPRCIKNFFENLKNIERYCISLHTLHGNTCLRCVIACRPKPRQNKKSESEVDIFMKETTVLSADYGRAVRLNQHIKAHAQIAQESLYEVCKGLKEMRDNKLYKELNYQSFEDYCEQEAGIKHSQAYKYIAIATNLSEDFFHTSGNIGMSKLSLLAMLDETERQKLQQKIDIDAASVREMQKQIKELKQNNQKLELQIWNYENQTPEQAVSSAEEQRFARFASDMNQQIVEERQRMKKESQEEIQRANLQRDYAYLEVEKLREKLAQKEDIPEESPKEKQFRIQLAVFDSCTEPLLNFLREHPDAEFFDESETILKDALNALDKIREKTHAKQP